MYSFSTSSLFRSTEPNDPEKLISPTTATNKTETDSEAQSKTKKVNIKLLSKLIRKKIDYSKRHTANNFYTTSRACNEYLLKPT